MDTTEDMVLWWIVYDRTGGFEAHIALETSLQPGPLEGISSARILGKARRCILQHFKAMPSVRD